MNAELHGGVPVGFDALVAETMTVLRGEVEGISLESDLPFLIAGADNARMLTFTWQPDGLTEPVRTWYVIAARGSTILDAMITTYESQRDYYQSAVDRITTSLEMSDP